jgi:hypothetical protein
MTPHPLCHRGDVAKTRAGKFQIQRKTRRDRLRTKLKNMRRNVAIPGMFIRVLRFPPDTIMSASAHLEEYLDAVDARSSR